MSKQKVQASENFSKIISDAITENNDDLLIQIISNNRDKIDQITDHKHLFNLAVSKKSTHTFALLLNCGFDPKKGNTPNPLAFAAKTQGSDLLSRYCEAISGKFEQNSVSDLINEKDVDGKNALSYGLEGRSYLGTIQFLIDNGANIAENFLHNAKLAIENRHVKTLEFILKSKDVKVTEEQLSELSKHAKQHNNHITQNLFAVYAEEHGFNRVKIEIDSAIDSHRDKKGSSTDIFEICRKGSLEDLEFLLEVLKVRREAPLINSNNFPKPAYDQNGKSALFYALNNNCYDPLVSRLLDQGAIITDLESTRRAAYHSRPIDALTVCILNKEPKTLATILKHPNLDMVYESNYKNLDMVYESNYNLLLGHQEFGEIVKEMLSPQHLNAVIVESFFTNISDFRLRNMEEETLVNLVKKSLEYAPEAAAEKLRKSFSKAVEDSSLKFVEILLENFSKSDLTTAPEQKQNSRKSTRPIDEERIGLLKTRTASSSYNSNADVESQQVTCDELFKKALEKAGTDSQSHNKSDSREILILLLKNGIEPSNKVRMAQDLAAIGIVEQDYRNPGQSICARMCSALSNALGFSQAVH
jgi:hypothetical protein